MPSSTRSRLLAAALAAVAALSFAACGDTTEPDDDSAAADEMSGEASPATDGSGGETVTVEIGDFLFDPDPIQVSAGDRVVWHNAHSQPHTSTGTGDQAWSSGTIAEGGDSEPVLFEAAGTYSYICALHPFMKGTVEVV
jgi:plastocyanin